MNKSKRNNHTFGLVLSGGGVRGLAHVGALKALEELTLVPNEIVGVSMGAIVGTVYGLRDDWYSTLKNIDFLNEMRGNVSPLHSEKGILGKISLLIRTPRFFLDFFSGWGFGRINQAHAMKFLSELTLGKKLEDSRVNITAISTDLLTGQRIVINKGNAATAIYASSALAGVFQPLILEKYCLADGGYTDIAPVDIVRNAKNQTVIAIDVTQLHEIAKIENGFQAITRAMDICHNQHAHLRFSQADISLRPEFPRQIDTLDFSAKADCIKAGYEVIKKNKTKILNQIAKR